MGEAMNYWDFYPAEDDSGPGSRPGDMPAVVVSKAEESRKVPGSSDLPAIHAVLEPGRIRVGFH